MSILIMIILLSILILVHELGHFLAARMFGIKVKKFALGFPIGPTLWQKQVGDTLVLVHAFLIGGYVEFEDDDKDCDLPKDSPDRFLNRPIYQRAIVTSAGVVFNVICAYLIVIFASFHWGHLPASSYEIYVNNIVAPKEASIWQSGIQKNDKIVSLNGIKITNLGSILSIVKNSKAHDGFYNKSQANEKLAHLKEMNLAFQTDEVIPKGVTVKLPEIDDESPVNFSKEAEMGIVKYNNSDEKLDEKLVALRDDLIANNYSYFTGNEQFTLEDISKAMSDTRHPIIIKVQRDGKIIELNTVYTDNDGKIGIEFAQKSNLVKTKGIKSVVKQSTIYLWDNTYNMLYGLGQIFTGKIPFKDLHGIVAITKVGGDIISNSGIFYGLLLTAIISMDLAIVNFLPIPALDGGHILFLIIEKIRGRRLKDETVDKIGTFFFSLLIVLMVAIIFNDILWLKAH